MILSTVFGYVYHLERIVHFDGLDFTTLLIRRRKKSYKYRQTVI
jgi:hypothetical protein